MKQLFSIEMALNMDINTVDIKEAFLNAKKRREVSVHPVANQINEEAKEVHDLIEWSVRQILHKLFMTTYPFSC